MPQSPEKRLSVVQETLFARGARRALFPSALFADPAWDILLTLYAAALEERPCGLDDLASAGVAAKDVVRIMDDLEREGLVATPGNAGPARFALTNIGLDKLECFFSWPIATNYG